ncbi:TetR family transcriptional regulator [Agrobacterium sp. NPDC089420]|uniref:TetR family transcriptional regulator n=1 Tax=Agrobacterium sp. NPDC089420 TaxID=3363918 RepID=UPI003850BB13
MRRTKEEAERTRASILLSAESTFLKNGFAETTLAQIAEGANLTRGAVHWHFDDKAAIFSALVFESLEGYSWRKFMLPAFVYSGENALSDIQSQLLNWLIDLGNDASCRRRIALLLRARHENALVQTIQKIEIEHNTRSALMLQSFRRAETLGEFVPCWDGTTAFRAVTWALKGLSTEWALNASTELASEARGLLVPLFQSFSGSALKVALRE